MSFQIQRQIKQNAQQIRTYTSDLYDWQQQMQLKQKAKNKILKQQRAKQEQIKKHLQKQIAEKKKQIPKQQDKSTEKPVDLVRDTTTIKDYYRAWDKYDVDTEITKLEEDELRPYKPYNPYENSQNYVRAKPKAKVNINIRSQRAAVIDPSQLKDKGNIHFKVCEYQKAIDAYTQCLQKLSEQQIGGKTSKLKCVVLSNRAMAYMKVNQNSKALKDCTESLRHDHSYVKSYLRRGECHKKLGNYLESLADFKKIKELDPTDQDIDSEIRKIEKYLDKLYKEARQSLIVQNPSSVIPNSFRIPIEEVAQIQDVMRQNTSNIKKEPNYLEEL